MAFTNPGTLGTEWDAVERVKRAQGLMAAFRAIGQYVDDQLADPADLRPKDGLVDQRRAQEVGLPIALRRFDRAAFERARDDLDRMLELEQQHRVAASRR